jgi:dCTP deaminase
MSFWSSEKIKETAVKCPLVEPYDEKSVEHCAYELGLGPEAFLTSNDENKKTVLKEGEQLVIPPGQFCLLLTEESVCIPSNAIGLISIKAGIKFRGLVNVSGFHVDPGFQGRLKFSVYNAGSQNIVLQRKQRVFLLWFCDLDRSTSDTYKGARTKQFEISAEDVMRMQGEIASPGQLKKEIEDLKVSFNERIHTLTHKLDNIKLVLAWLVSIATSIALFSMRGCISTSDPNSFSGQTTNHVMQATNVADAQLPTTGK